MLNSTDRSAESKTQANKQAARAEAAAVVAGLNHILEADEQLLGFARGAIAGGIKGKLTVGPEAMLAPSVNVGLTDRRLMLQHINSESGRRIDIQPHFFKITDIHDMVFSDIETFGGPPACRLLISLLNGQQVRLRLSGESSFQGSKALVSVFKALTATSRSMDTASQRVCTACGQVQDSPSRFCPYCGAPQPTAAASTPEIKAEAEPETTAEVKREIEHDSVVAALAELELATALTSVPIEHPLPMVEAIYTEMEAATTPPVALEAAAAPAEHYEEPVPFHELQGTTAVGEHPADPTSVDTNLAAETTVANVEPPYLELVTEQENQIPEYEFLAESVVEPEWASASVDSSSQMSMEPVVAETLENQQNEEPIPVPVNETPAETEPQTEASPSRLPTGLIVHFNVDHPAVRFNETLRGKDADDVVAQLKSHAANNLKFPLKLAIMRMTAGEFCREVIQRYNYAENRSLPIPTTCDEFLKTSQLIGFATIEPDYEN